MLKSIEFERITIKGVLGSKDFLKKLVQRNITDEIFTTPVFRFIYKSSLFHYKRNFDVLTFNDLRYIIDNQNGNEDDRKIRLSALTKCEQELSIVPEEPSRYYFVFNELIKLYQYRKYVEINERYLNSVKSLGIQPQELYQKVQNELNKVRQDTGEIEIRRDDLFSDESVSERLKQYEQEAESDNTTRIPYPFPKMNEITGGINNTDLIIFAARQKVGKSIMLLNVANHLTNLGYNGIYFTIEQSREEIAMREDSLATQLKHRDIRLRELAVSDKIQYQNVLKERASKKAKFIVIDMPRGCTVPFIESETRSIIEDGIKLDFIVIDYLGLIGSDTGETDPIKTMGRITMCLKQIARELKLPIITAQQMNRESDKEKKKENRHIAYSDQQGAHVNAMFALVPGEDPNSLELQTVLARDHEYFTLKLLTHYETMLIVEDQNQDSEVEEVSSEKDMKESFGF